jgi:hypothetical protein
MDELPFSAPEVRIGGQKVSSLLPDFDDQGGLEVLSADRMRPSTQGKL